MFDFQPLEASFQQLQDWRIYYDLANEVSKIRTKWQEKYARSGKTPDKLIGFRMYKIWIYQDSIICIIQVNRLNKIKHQRNHIQQQEKAATFFSHTKSFFRPNSSEYENVG